MCYCLVLLHADRILNPELFHWRNMSTADLGIFSLGRKISASQSLPRNIFASVNIPAGKSILAEYSGCYTGIHTATSHKETPAAIPHENTTWAIAGIHTATSHENATTVAPPPPPPQRKETHLHHTRATGYRINTLQHQTANKQTSDDKTTSTVGDSLTLTRATGQITSQRLHPM